MTNNYTKRIIPIIIGLIEEGGYTYKAIAELCNVSIYFVRKVINGYDGFYAGKI